MTDGVDPIPGLVTFGSFTDWIQVDDLTAWWRLGDTFTFASSVTDAMLNSATFDANDASRHLDYAEPSSSDRPTLQVAHTELGTSDDGAVEFNKTSSSSGGPYFFSTDAQVTAVAQFGTTSDLLQTVSLFLKGKAWSFGTWFGPVAGMWGMDGSGSFNVGWVVQVEMQTGQLSFVAKPAGGASTYQINGPILVDDQWYHVAVTWDGTNWRLYVNGGFYAATTGTSAPANPSDLQGFSIGYAKYDSGATFTNNYFYGMVDEIALYRRVLTDLEIARIAGWFAL